jgi:hypothetical protein
VAVTFFRTLSQHSYYDSELIAGITITNLTTGTGYFANESIEVYRYVTLLISQLVLFQLEH